MAALASHLLQVCLIITEVYSSVEKICNFHCILNAFCIKLLLVNIIINYIELYIIYKYKLYPFVSHNIIYTLYYIFIYILVAETVKNLSSVNWGLISELGRSPGEGNGNPLQYFYLENHMDRET